MGHLASAILAAALGAALSCGAAASILGPNPFSIVDSTAGCEDPSLAGCALATASGVVPADLYQREGPFETDEYPGFDRVVVTRGVTLLAEAEVSDGFLERVADTLESMLPQFLASDPERQEAVIRAMFRHKAVVPIVSGYWEAVPHHLEDSWSSVAQDHTVCDGLMEGVPGQALEVVEHLLHALTEVGLKSVFPRVWGTSGNTPLALATETAIRQGWYNVEHCAGLSAEAEAERRRGMAKEFAYWFTTTVWDLQDRLGPLNEDEWVLRSRPELLRLMPDFFASFQTSAAQVLQPPNVTVLATFGTSRDGALPELGEGLTFGPGEALGARAPTFV
ncbi:hypothetical protein FNF27_05484 [Cafeteria roenbergensis]|uniref:Uncharacterized protein n=2 Tax=Cafeteria roenbergensis TaxID=33653 RepID=A0A5A8C0Y8_CAFRO|nr:hypothetical protein FNF29_08122 [Cafeteria roenbergensis]KAA0172993.1 hypothetical protein FNF27_05484 [Cafeteria roenbergensis]|eukprot:KAA0146307.1 hypothetical protein FNF29_08122 [Cafeteria roenbergensis]